MMLVSDADPLRVRDRHRLRDHPAHRHPDDVRGRRARGGRAARRRRRPGRRGEYGARTRVPANARTSVRPADPALEHRGAAGVAVVVADDVEAGAGQALAQLGVPPGHRPAEAHHQQQRVVVGVAEGLVAELDAAPDRREQLLGDGDGLRRAADGYVVRRALLSQPVGPTKRDTTTARIRADGSVGSSVRRRNVASHVARRPWPTSCCRTGFACPRPAAVLREGSAVAEIGRYALARRRPSAGPAAPRRTPAAPAPASATR